MKKILVTIILGLLVLGISACNTETLEDNFKKEVLSSEQALASMAYLSSNFLSFNNDTSNQTLALNLADDELEVESELETVSEYLELLKVFMENGASNFGSIIDEVSDRVEYDNKTTIVVAEKTYLLYYSVDSETREISGIFVIDEVEYEITAYSYLDDEDDFYKDEDDDEDDDEDEADDLAFKLSEVTTTEEENETTTTEENTEVTTEEENETMTEETTTVFEEFEREMQLIARYGENYIEIKYEIEIEEDETESKFEMNTYIDGVEKEITIEIKVEEDEYKIEIEEGDNEYEFKREIEDEGIKYELKYSVNGVEGEIKIIETTNELGEVIYIYEIEEEGRYKEVEVEDRFDDDDDDDDDDEDDDDDDLTDTSFKL